MRVRDAQCMTPHMTTLPTVGAPAAGRSVFIVDDDPALVETLAEILREEGYQVDAHTDARTALSLLRSGIKPDVVLLDYLMPVMNGDQFLAALESSGLALNVVLFTGMNAPQVRGTERLVRGVLRKPFDIERLLNELDRLRAEDLAR
jgi:CheY-like chemotaxis protein